MKTVVDEIIDALHEKFGICGHCGKKKCYGKAGNSRLPNTLSTDDVLEIVNRVCDNITIPNTPDA